MIPTNERKPERWTREWDSEEVEDAIAAAVKDCVCNGCRERLQIVFANAVEKTERSVWEKALAVIPELPPGDVYNFSATCQHGYQAIRDQYGDGCVCQWNAARAALLKAAADKSDNAGV